MAETMSHRKASEKSMSEILVKEYLTIQEVAILLGLSRQTIYNMVYSGKLRAPALLYNTGGHEVVWFKSGPDL